MKLYFRSDMEQVHVSETDHIHMFDLDEESNRKVMAADCTACEPYLRDLGGKSNPADVELTYDETRTQDRMATAQVAFGRELVGEMARLMAGNPQVLNSYMPSRGGVR